ncbi:MAG: alpha-2-macroglobulin family protein [Cytophagaceae bacterium]|nr:alpha-2-macroglobulin family protein [Cytophagaceae bacterium]MDW8455672.1 alpha-2-macroglobulin [Cytophagaceae bacterium]
MKFPVHIRFISLLIIAIALHACNKNTLKIDKKNFGEEVQEQQNLVFNFNQNLTPDSLLNVWIEAAYINFTPAVRGKYKWTANDELVFSPDVGFMPSTDYTAEFTEELLKNSGSKYNYSSDLKFSFHTPYLTIAHSNSYWARNSVNKGIIELRMDLQFNAKVNPQEVIPLMKLQAKGQTQNFTLQSNYVSDQLQLAIPEGNVKMDDEELTVQIDKGLKCAESNFVTKEPIVHKTVIPSKDKFQIVRVEAMYEEEKGYITVVTNQEIAEQNMSGLVTVYPYVQHTIEPHESGFFIKGNFMAGNAYKVSIKKTLKGIFGGALNNDFEQDVVFGALNPAIAFVSKKGLYLSSKGEKNVAVKIIAVPEVKVTVYKVYENNLISFIRQNASYYGYDNEYYDGYDYEREYYGLEEIGDVVFERTYNTKTFQKKSGYSLLNLNFDEINDFRGIYVVKVHSTDQQYINASKVISISDIGMIVKETGNDIYVFTNSILTATPMSDVEVCLISSNNQTVYKVKTDAEGVAKFPDIKKKAPGFKINMVTCKFAKDFNYLHFNECKIGTSEYEVGGAFSNPSGYEAFIYGDREIYRPGDTLYSNFIVRDASWKPVKNLPIKIKLLLPNGKEFLSKRAVLNEQGAYSTFFTLPVNTVTGTYILEAYTANDVLMQSKYISVEEFIPDRIKVSCMLNKEEYTLRDRLELTATALNLFGPPAADRNYEIEVTLQKKYFSPAAYKDYTFELSSISTQYFPNELRTGKTDSEGKAKENFSFNTQYAYSGILQGKVYTTVFDESGRPVHQVNSFDVLTQPVFLGIKNFDSYVDVNKALLIPVVAVDKNEKPLSSVRSRIKIIKYNWQTVVEKNYNGSYRYVSRKKEQVLEDKFIIISGTQTNFTFKPTQSGEYEVQLMLPEATSYVSRYFYAYSYGTTTNESFEVNNEGSVVIESDKTVYQPGDKAKLLFKAPFDGRLLVTIERDKVYDYFYLNTENKSASLNINMKEDYLPNVYVSATLFRENSESAVPLTVGHGYKPLMVEKTNNKISLTIEADERTRANTEKTVCVKTNAGANVEVTIAIVDEGILQLKNTRTPDPYGFFYRKRALEVNSYDVYPKLLPELSPKKSSVAGDGYDLEKRNNPLSNRRVKLVAFWSGQLKTDSDGKACTTIKIPQFSGDLRIMAVAYSGSSFGSASKNMKVADPVVVSTSLPRFLSPGDTAIVPVTLTNTTAKVAQANAKLTTQGPLQVIGDAVRTVKLSANAEARIEFKIFAKSEIGVGKVTTSVSCMNDNFTDVTEISVRPASSLIKESGAGQIAGGSTAKVSLKTNLIPASMKAKLIVSKSPLIQFAGNLDFLLGYPHGCVEQTVSKAFPQLYFHDLVKSMSVVNKNTEDPTTHINEAIRKLSAMQLYNGALSYWPGGYQESWWGTAYAAHFLQEAKKAGYDVNPLVLDKMYGYLQQKVKEKNLEEYYYYENTTYKSKPVAPKEIFYSLYLLASTGRQDLSVMNYYKANQHLLALDSRYLLAATYRLLGDMASYKKILPSSFAGEKSINALGSSFYSYVRDLAISLNMLIETDPSNEQIGILAQHLSKELKSDPYLSTQECAFAFVALGKIARKANETDITADIAIGNSVLSRFTGKDVILTKDIAGKEIEIITKGTGTLYYFWQMEGLSPDGKVKEEDSYIRIRKTFYDRKGREIHTLNFNQNDLVVVKLSLNTLDNSTANNVVITDILPAGFEIENPRLTESAGMAWIDDNTQPQHFDVRDDRINIYTDATGSVRNYYYIVRAVSKGSFIMGPASADAMYNGEYHSYHGSAKINIR